LGQHVVLSPSHDGITSLVIFPTVQLVHRYSWSLLPVVVYCIQSRLRMLTEQFCKRMTITRVGKEFIFPHEGPSSRVEMPYAFMMA